MSAGLPAWVPGFLESARVGRLGTVDAGGRPLVVPVCYVWDGGACYSAVDRKPKRTGAPLRRLRNIAENPCVSLVVDHYEEDWSRLRYVIVEGRAEILTAGDEYGRGVDLLRGKYPQYEALPLDRHAGALIKIAPDRLLAWSYT
jgi:PPOX class probable F420-dependent enzyme